MEIYEKILSEVGERSLLVRGDKVIASVSGGPDSTFLLEFLVWAKKKLGIEIHVFHLDHMLRGQDSRDDLKFVRHLAENHGLPYTSVRRDINKLKLSRKGSLQDVARDIRKEELNKLLIKTAATKIATAHHLDDRIETFFQRLLRGAGRKGLASISYKDGVFVRPLLSITKGEILAGLRNKNIAFRTDSSNADVKYLRNKVRLRLIPSLSDISPNYQQSVRRFMDIQESEESEGTELAKNFLRVLENNASRKNPASRSRYLRVEDLRLIDDGYVSLIIRELIREQLPSLKGIEKRHSDLIITAIKKDDTGFKIELPGQTFASITDGLLIIGKNLPSNAKLLSSRLKVPGVSHLKASCDKQKPIGSGIRIKASIIEGDRLEKLKETRAYRTAIDSEVAYLDLAKCGHKLDVTKRRTGDRMKPFGLNGQKKIQDILVDRKISKAERDLVPIIRSGDKIVWVAGICISDDVRIAPGTAKVLKVQIYRKNS